MVLRPYLSPINLTRQFASALLLKKTTGWRQFVPWALSNGIRSIPVAAGAVGMGCIGFGYHAVWEVTEACNLSCRHCHAKSGAAGPDELTTAEAFSFLEDVSRIGRFQMLVFTGGEPLFRPDIDDLLNYSKRLGLVNVIATNGHFIDRKRALELKRLGVKGVAVSFDSTDPKIHNYIRCHPQAFELAIRAIEACKAAGMVVQLNYTAMSENLSTLPEVVRFCHEIRADIMLCYQLVPMGRGSHIMGSALSPQQNQELVQTIRRLQKDSVTVIEPVAAPQYWPHLRGRDNTDPKRVAGPALFHGCTAGWGLVYVKPNGDVWPCPFVPISGGNVREKPLRDIWKQGKIFRQLRDRDQLQGTCGECENRYICGGCRGKAYAASGNPLGEDPTCYVHHSEWVDYHQWVNHHSLSGKGFQRHD